MWITKTIKKTQKILEKYRNKTIGFVPTMGALHEGHLSLIRRCVKENQFSVVSIFVNPIQFGRGEDFSSYPRPFKKDIELCKKEGVNLVFAPSYEEMYPDEFSVYVEEISLSKFLCGKFRPSHFKGVCTVVAKLFNIIRPRIAYFGQKDYQQAQIIKRMVDNLNFNIKIKVLPIVRDKDGLALSSRNWYLNPQERKQAVCLYESLKIAKKMIEDGEREAKKIIFGMKKTINKFNLAKIQYIEVADAYTLEPTPFIKKDVVIALAVFIGKARLIDNMLVKFKKKKIIFKL